MINQLLEPNSCKRKTMIDTIWMIEDIKNSEQWMLVMYNKSSLVEQDREYIHNKYIVGKLVVL